MTLAAEHQPKDARARAWAGRALGWWLAELAALYRDAARWLRAADRHAVTIEAGERYWSLRQYQRPIGQVDWGSLDTDSGRRALAALIPDSARRQKIIIEIPPERVLSKIIAFPTSARAELDRILEFEIARHFPFPASRVFFRHRVVGRRAIGHLAGGQPGTTGAAPIAVEIVAVPREIVAAICDDLAAAGLQPGGIAMVTAGDAEPLFLPAAALGQAGASPRRGRLPLGIAVAMLAVAAAVSWPLAQQFRLAALDRELATLKPRAEMALKTREGAQREAVRSAALIGLRSARPPLVGLLDALSRDVPDGSWLLSLSIAGREVVIDGLSPSAATIALALQRDRMFGDIVFRSAITREAATGLEHFQLGAVIAEVQP